MGPERSKSSGSIINDPQVRGIFYQAITIIILTALIYWIVDNTVDNLRRANIASGYDFLRSRAGFDVGQSLISFTSDSTYGRALLVGFINTLLVAITGIITATIIGFLVGIGRLSHNWIIAKLSLAYVEVFRNIPPLLVIFFWYSGVLSILPQARDALTLPFDIFLSNRGVAFPRPVAGEGAEYTLLAFIFLVPMLIPRIPYKGLNALLLLGALPVLAAILLPGGWFGLTYVETPLWGGLMVTLVLSFVGIAVSLPLGILLALGRRSNMPVIKMLCTAFIEVIRGVPLITVLFMASVMLPLFLPQGVTFDKFLRALIGVSLFASAYMAEVVRGGLQAIPKGQYEGADSLGLSYWQKMGFIVLPQALKLVIPGIVNTFIGLFKDTSLVSIIGMFDLLGIVRLNFSDTNWASAVTPLTGLIFAGFVFWLFCFGMSR
ncbi:ABC transporter permease subunit, partial [Sinorhizobium meliloti]|uniref:ABC transporter permease subunit n=2 Tax=Rhizobium meliloti TaxID=382 RepID=UPI003B5167FE